MTLFYYDPIFLEHDTGQHPENANRLRAVTQCLDNSSLNGSLQRMTWDPATSDEVCLVHQPETFDAIKSFADKGGGQIEADTVVSKRSFDATSMAAGAACDAVRQVLSGVDKTAFCAVRPPGHHALPDQPMGFCLFNSVAVAARLATQKLGCERVLIVDWDVHHGNGTQDIFWEDPSVGFLSMHRFPFYPGSGRADEVGNGAGKGTTVNLPIAFGTSRKDQLDKLRGGVEDFADQLKPDLVLISAGFDSHATDPVGSLGLETEDFEEFTKIVLDVAKAHAGGRVVSLLEGGYNPEALAESVECHLTQLAK